MSSRAIGQVPNDGFTNVIRRTFGTDRVASALTKNLVPISERSLSVYKSSFASKFSSMDSVLDTSWNGPVKPSIKIQETIDNLSRQHSDEEYESDEERSPSSSTASSSGMSFNSTFVDLYTKLLGRCKRSPQLTAPIRTIISVPSMFKEHYEKQAEMERVTKKKEHFGKTITEERPHKVLSKPVEVVEGSTYYIDDDYTATIPRQPSLTPCMRSVLIKKDRMLGSEDSIRTRFIGERDVYRTNNVNRRIVKSASTIQAPAQKRSFKKEPTRKLVTLPASTLDCKPPTVEAEQKVPPMQQKIVASQPTNQTTTKPKQFTPLEVMETKKSATVNDVFSESNKEQFAPIAKWIQRELGIEFNMDKQCEMELKNGTKLAEIMGRLEGEEKMKGINRQPQTSAAVLNNLERSMTVLRENKNMKADYLWSMKEIIGGDEQSIWGLLGDIYETYRRKTVKRTKKPQNKKINETTNIQISTTNSSDSKQTMKKRMSKTMSLEEPTEFSLEDILAMKRALLESSGRGTEYNIE